MDARESELMQYVNKCISIQEGLEIDFYGDYNLAHLLSNWEGELYLAAIKMRAGRVGAHMDDRLFRIDHPPVEIPTLPEVNVDLSKIETSGLLDAYWYLVDTIFEDYGDPTYDPESVVEQAFEYGRDQAEENSGGEVLDVYTVCDQVEDWAKFLVEQLNERLPNQEWWNK